MIILVAWTVLETTCGTGHQEASLSVHKMRPTAPTVQATQPQVIVLDLVQLQAALEMSPTLFTLTYQQMQVMFLIFKTQLLT